MTRSIFLTFSALLMLVGFAPLAGAEEETKKSPIEIENVYAFATAPGHKMGAIFLTLENKGSEKDTLLSAASDVAEMVQIHENKIDEETGIMQMREIDGVTIAPDTKEILEPAGNHIMLMGLKEELLVDKTFDVTLTFEKAGEISLPVSVITPGSKPNPHTSE